MRKPFSTVHDIAHRRLSRSQRWIVLLLVTLIFLVSAAAGVFVLGSVSHGSTPLGTTCVLLLMLLVAYQVAKGSNRWLCMRLSPPPTMTTPATPNTALEQTRWRAFLTFQSSGPFR